MSSDFEIKRGVLIKYYGSNVHVVIPDGVKAIGKDAFSDSMIFSITIPNSVTKIEDSAFYRCKHLTSITIPDSVTEIGDSAFVASNLESITIPNSVAKIGDMPFYNCRSLTSVKLPENLKEIDGGLFAMNTSLTEIEIPKSVTKIGNAAFMNCKKLTSITIPKGVTKIGSIAFQGCLNLATVFIPDSVTEIDKDTFNHDPVLTIVCRENSYTHHYCTENNISFVFDYQYEAFHGLFPPGIEKLASPFLADEEKPNIFVSYSHRDRDQILPIIKTLYESGWKIWYDEGLTIGDRYDETLEEHVRNCSAFLLFVTRNSLNSNYIKKNEIPWANQYGKPIIKCILDKGIDYEIKADSVLATVSQSEIEPALKKVSGLTKGKQREAKGITVIVNPSDRGNENADGFAYCLYAKENAAKARTILYDAKDYGCNIYDAVEKGTDRRKLQNSACLIVILDKAFLENAHLTKILIDTFRSSGDIAICQTEEIEDEDLPEELLALHKMQWLNYVHGITGDMNKKLARHLKKRGCVNSAALPGFEYEKTDKGIVIKRYKGKDPDPRIESEYGGVPVVEIAENAFENCFFIKTITLPQSIQSIGDNAFRDCKELTSVILRGKIKTTVTDAEKVIGNHAFKNCENLSSITIPDSITKIKEAAFDTCKSLTSVFIPDSVKEIERRAFHFCKSLTSITIPDSVTIIGKETFYLCDNLTSIILPDHLTTLEESIFTGCNSLKTIIIPDSVKTIKNHAFFTCNKLLSINFPDSVTDIGEGLFFECFNLTSVHLPNGITEIKKSTFEECSNLTDVNIPNSVKIIGYSAFRRCGFTSIAIPDSVTEIGDSAFGGCKNLTSVVIPDSVTKIGDSAFCGCKNLTSIVIPDSVTEIGDSAFENCKGLADDNGFVIIRGTLYDYFGDDKEVSIPDNVTKINYSIFSDRSELTSVTIPNGVTTIPANIFYYCKSLTSVTLPDSVTTIEDRAFNSQPPTVICSLRSYAWKYCKKHKIPVKSSAESSRKGIFGKLFGK